MWGGQGFPKRVEEVQERPNLPPKIFEDDITYDAKLEALK